MIPTKRFVIPLFACLCISLFTRFPSRGQETLQRTEKKLVSAKALVKRSSSNSRGSTEDRISELIARMTLVEKVAMIHANSSFTSAGVPRLHIPELKMSDGPHGVRPEQGRFWVQKEKVADSGTYLPTGLCLASTWNPELGYAFGKVLGSEANYRGKDIILGPGINIIRTPLNGRNFEYLSEDPFLISKMAVGYINGVQDQGVSACVKHYLANNQETNRNTVDVQMSNRALREIYLPGFKAAVTEGHVNSLMGAYNKFRGQWCTHNAYLMDSLLKGEFKFDGVVISDWGAVHNTMEALTNGTDLEMGTDLSMLPHPNYHKFFMGDPVLTLVGSGKVSESVINDKVRRILRLMFKTHMIGATRAKGSYNTKEHQNTALKIAEEGIILLKNQDRILPLSPSGLKSIAVIGANANRHQSMGGGSSQIKAYFEITPLEGIKRLVGAGVAVNYAPGYVIKRGETADTSLIRQAAALASKSDIAIVVGGWTHGFDYAKWSDNAYDAEDQDKADLQMPFGQNELIKAIIRANPKTVVVLMGGGPLDINSWLDSVKALVQVGYPGMNGGKALAEILFGKVNPSGKLTMTWPKKLADCPSEKLGEYPGGATEQYKEDIFVGYRYYDTYNVLPMFEFGYGMSYTTFQYSQLHVEKAGDSVKVTFNIQNTGSVAGSEIAQLYISQKASALPRPSKELKGFSKVFLNPGETKPVTLTLDRHAFEYYNDKLGRWVFEPGTFTVLLGTSSRHIYLTSNILI